MMMVRIRNDGGAAGALGAAGGDGQWSGAVSVCVLAFLGWWLVFCGGGWWERWGMLFECGGMGVGVAAFWLLSPTPGSSMAIFNIVRF